MSALPDDYVQWWRGHTSAGPADWCSEHHRQPDSHFTALCKEAECRKLDVEVTVSDKLYGAKPDQYRLPANLSVGQHCQEPLITVPIQGSLSAAADRALELLKH